MDCILFTFFFFLSLYEKKLQKTQENNRNTRVSDELFDLASQIGGDLFAGFLVIYTYITSHTLTVNETKNNLVDRNIELIKTSKKMNRCI